MKSTAKQIGASLIIVMLFTLSCHKDNNSTPTPTTTTNTGNGLPTTLGAFFQQYGAQTQTFTINATTGGSFKGVKGTKFFIAANSLLTSANATVTGNVTVQVKELYSPSDMVLSNMTTMAGNSGLLSQGMFNINFTQGNNALHLAPAAEINAHMPLADSTINQDTTQVFSNENSTWVPDRYGCSVSFLPDSTNVTCDSIHWINADCYYSGGPDYQVTVNPVNSPDISQTTVYMFVNGHHAIWSLSAISGNQFITPDDIPESAPLTIIGLAISSNGTVYTAFLPYTNGGSNQTVNLSFSASTISAFQTQLAALH